MVLFSELKRTAIPAPGLQVMVCAFASVRTSARQEWQVFNTSLHIFSSVMNSDRLETSDYSSSCKELVREDFWTSKVAQVLPAELPFPNHMEEGGCSNVGTVDPNAQAVTECNVEGISSDEALECIGKCSVG
jgi:hypothetical protein